MAWTRHLQDAWDRAAESLFYVTAAVCIFGFAATVLSIPLGFGFVEFAGTLEYRGETLQLKDFPASAKPKEVGYLSALNWSLYGAIILPVIVVFCLRVRAAMRTTLGDIAAAGVLRQADFSRVSPEAALARWHGHQKGEIVLVAIVGVLVIAFALYDWWQVVGAPLLQLSPLPGRPLADPIMEYDWSVSSLFPGASAATWPLLLFSLVVFVVIPGLGSALAFATFISALHFLVLVSGVQTPRGEPRWRLAAVPDPDDQLKGFGAFAPLFSSLVSAAVAIIFGLLVMMIQNNYLRSPDDSVFAFLWGEGLKLSTLLTVPPSEYMTKLFGWFRDGSLFFGRNPQVGVGLLVFAFVFTTSLAACWAILRTSARAGGKWSEANAELLAAETGRSVRKVRKDLADMTYWPIGWISLNELFLLLVFLLAAVFSYRLALLAGLWVLLKSVRALPGMVKALLPKLPRRASAGT